MVEHRGDRPLRHEQFRDVVVDREYAFNHALIIAQIDRAGFEHSAVARLGQIAQFVAQRWVVFALNRLQHNAGCAAARLTMRDMPVFDHRDRVLGVVAGDIVHDDLTAFAKFRGDCLGKTLQEFQIHGANPLPLNNIQNKKKIQAEKQIYFMKP
ncbi:hypothetical protein SDC9_113120 [bioreactor metagenome]|uniref:Uncharacterized protein n=1 Tax=bioreactor metagenome TaxID=1076179 RepID=A0A645BSK6_9ZZZZ